MRISVSGWRTTEEDVDLSVAAVRRALARGPVRGPRRRIASPGPVDRSPYPPHWEADVVLRDGSTAHLRPIRPDDADRLRDFHGALSPETVYFRFFAPYPT